jgi:hypothetical protein
MPAAGKGWRAVTSLNARVTEPARRGDLTIDIDALEVTAENSSNFPSKKIVIDAFLKDGRLGEKSKRRP